jgi:hypothetical protein
VQRPCGIHYINGPCVMLGEPLLLGGVPERFKLLINSYHSLITLLQIYSNVKVRKTKNNVTLFFKFYIFLERFLMVTSTIRREMVILT